MSVHFWSVAAVLLIVVLVVFVGALLEWVERSTAADEQADIRRPGEDDQFGTWPTLRVPETRLVALCAACRTAPVCLPGPHLAGRFCAGCIDTCWNDVQPGHRCPVCTPPTAPPVDHVPSTSTPAVDPSWSPVDGGS